MEARRAAPPTTDRFTAGLGLEMTECMYRLHTTTVNGSKLYDDNEFATACKVPTDKLPLAIEYMQALNIAMPNQCLGTLAPLGRERRC
jgi:hypothetical protein